MKYFLWFGLMFIKGMLTGESVPVIKVNSVFIII